MTITMTTAGQSLRDAVIRQLAWWWSTTKSPLSHRVGESQDTDT